MSYRSAWLVSVLLATGCAFDGAAGASGDALVVTEQCEVAGMGWISATEFGGGTVRGGDSGAVGTWSHHSAIGTLVAHDPDWILCRINGSLLADFEGDATVDGVPGYTYRVSVQDRGTPPAPTTETLTASVQYRPRRWTDASLPVPEGTARVTLPNELPVIEGKAGHGLAVLSFEPADGSGTVRCRYRGNGWAWHRGDAYVLRHCVSRSGRAAYGAGDIVEVSAMTLHVQSGFPGCRSRRTTVSVELEVVHPAPGEFPDYYRVAVWDASGAMVDLSQGVIAAGDFVITDLTR